MTTENTESLINWVKRTHPNQLRLGSVKIPVYDPSHYLPKLHPCHRCIAYTDRNPKDCDPCGVNPDKERMRRAGLL